MSKSRKQAERDQRFKEGDVIVVPTGSAEDLKERPALITRVGGDGSTPGDSTIEYEFIDADGSLDGGGHWSAEWAVPKGTKHMDFAEVKTVVTLPPEWQERAVEFERQKTEKEAVQKAKRGDGEWDPESHPSYGSVQVSRTSGHTALFGSPFKHQHYMTMRIGRAVKHRSLGHDRIHGGLSNDMVEVAMSEAQWARMLSSVGMGEGVPCTLVRIGGKYMESCPEQAEVERFHEDIERSAAKAMEFMTKALEQAEALVDEKAPSKAKRQEMVEALTFAKRQMIESAPWVAKMLHERMGTVVQEGKTELEAFMHRTLTEAGLQQLAEANAKRNTLLEMPESSAKVLPDDTEKKP